ncbi:hypothetical protein QCM77_40340 [Bradyrhizobium sp. SSUT18]|uniref:hypothetical protein n=1 Tax=Bradyrhizobium sp. SSUT18 TaxID=3040602 RepID=UPI00244BEF94|nr:hypothetical protein [Bradyrhizobium sp. SSUT18]MDH2406085.1 hypothetical protein [Bradyrhizobium sp. SSUT18]
MEEQLTFRVVDDCLDVSPYNWPPLAQDHSQRLFANMQAAFAQARMLYCTGVEYEGEDFGAIRPVASINAKQLACIKMYLWNNRTGQANGDRKYLAQHMYGLLNSDERAEIRKTVGTNQRLTAMFRGTYEGTGADIDKEWSRSPLLAEMDRRRRFSW